MYVVVKTGQQSVTDEVSVLGVEHGEQLVALGFGLGAGESLDDGHCTPLPGLESLLLTMPLATDSRAAGSPTPWACCFSRSCGSTAPACRAPVEKGYCALGGIVRVAAPTYLRHECAVATFPPGPCGQWAAH